ncbi:flagellar FliJ family protein [bacterium]|nr:flagellar FliJ family protein [bacterium]
MFRLDKVLRYKERLEREARGKRAVAEASLHEMEDAVARLRGERASLPDVDGTDFEALRTWAEYAEGLRRREARVHRRIGQLRPEVAELVRAHLEIRREVEGLRKLKERTRLRQRKRREGQAQIAMDEAAARTILPGGGMECRPEGIADDTGWPRATPIEVPETTVEAEMSTKRETEA